MNCFGWRGRPTRLRACAIWCHGVFTPEQDNDKVDTRSSNDGVKGIIGMHRFNICLVVVLLWYKLNTRVALCVPVVGFILPSLLYHRLALYKVNARNL